MDAKKVVYDENESLWKFGKLISRFPDEMLSHSLVFNSIDNNPPKNIEACEITKLKKNFEKELSHLKIQHLKEINEIKKKNEKEIKFWKEKYLYVKQNIEITMGFKV